MSRIRPSGTAAALAALLLLPALPAAARPGRAALDLPGAGPVSDVAQNPSRDGYSQRITFRDDPRAVAEVSVRNGEGGSGPAMAKPSRTGIAAELRARFPGETMRVVTQAHRNAYGPVGLALGNDCLYAWQWIDLGDAGRRRPSSLFGADGAAPAASMRIKLCRTATASLADLTRAVEQMRFSADSNAAPRAQEEMAARRQPLRRRDAASPRPRAPREAAQVPETTVRPPGAMERPGPEKRPEAAPRRMASEQSGETQRYLVPGPGAAPPVPAVPVPVPPAGGQGPRYITDAAQADGTVAITVPRPAPNRAEVEDLMARELPARAYRPPP
ncbi:MULTISPECIES: cellulose biosynthesis protein BcsN [Methylobacterium]|uniref:cellulose biosynthesis protein BcsN n=1 Tax=Methylobacterium TaxID=407 RepID=UPI0009EAF253|nr:MULTISPECIES: cellulose biosynthesis protein BcsN [Methylobacterium]MCI9882708.1 cellulose biosynthesis protein BcsN [Methylobacterium goesingense]